MAKFTKSENFKSEYSCAVVKVEELIPVEGSDFLAKTNVLGTQIVVRKDQVHEGDIMIYAANETVLNHKFLSVNNLYEISCREKNANAEEVAAIMAEYEPIKNLADKKRNEAKALKSKMETYTNNASKANKQIKKNESRMLDMNSDSEQFIMLERENIELRNTADEYTAKAMACSAPYVNLKKEVEDIVKSGKHIVDEAKKHCGFFNKYGRVRCLMLRGEPSFGFLFGLDDLQKFDNSITANDLLNYLGQEFDTINDELFVKVYVPPIKETPVRVSKGEKRNNKLKRFDRLIDGEFKFHYDTTQFEKVVSNFYPDDFVDISVKLHGTSVIISKCHVKEPLKLPIHKRLFNKFIDATGLFKDKRIQDYKIVYGPIFSSRSVIKNKYINSEGAGRGFYGEGNDLWSEWGDKIYPYLENGMTIYGEIVGYVTGSDSMIQNTYDYGCEPGTNKLMIYRITTTHEDSSRDEWEVRYIKAWTENLINRMKEVGDETYKQIHPIDVLFSGRLNKLYPDLDTTNHWHANLLERLKNDKKHFGMEENEPMCTRYEVPREGICIRRDGDAVPACYKLKTTSFKFGEAIRMDNGEVDSEMEEGYSEN